MHTAIKRVLAYVALACVLYGIATFFVESQVAFVIVFGIGLLIGLTAELMFWAHMFRLTRQRQRR